MERKEHTMHDERTEQGRARRPGLLAKAGLLLVLVAFGAAIDIAEQWHNAKVTFITVKNAFRSVIKKWEREYQREQEKRNTSWDHDSRE